MTDSLYRHLLSTQFLPRSADPFNCSNWSEFFSFVLYPPTFLFFHHQTSFIYEISEALTEHLVLFLVDGVHPVTQLLLIVKWDLQNRWFWLIRNRGTTTRVKNEWSVAAHGIDVASCQLAPTATKMLPDHAQPDLAVQPKTIFGRKDNILFNLQLSSMHAPSQFLQHFQFLNITWPPT